MEIPWKAEYHADDDDSNSAEEIKEKSYTLPEYIFTVSYNGVEQQQGEEKVLYVKGWGTHPITSDETDDSLSDSEYIMITSEGKLTAGKSDENGYAREKGVKIGNFTLIR